MQPNHWEDLELRHLAALEAIAVAGSFWAAAEHLDCSTSALSQQIATLERIVGDRVLDRSPGRRRVALTEPGRLLLRHADVIVARLRAARADLVAFGEGHVGELRIGTYQSVGAKLLPQVLRRFAGERPDIELRLVERTDADQLLRSVERGEIDLTFTVLPLPEGPFEGIELMRDPHVLLVPTDSALGRSGTANLSELKVLKLVGFRRTRPVAQFEDHLQSQGIPLNIVFRSDDSGTVQGMVAAGMGCALVSRLAVDLSDPAIRVVELPDMPPRVLGIAWHRDRHRSPAMHAFVEQALGVANVLGAGPTRTALRRPPAQLQPELLGERTDAPHGRVRLPKAKVNRR